MRRTSIILGILTITAGMAAVAMAQNGRVTITVKVKDQQAQPVEGAEVKVVLAQVRGSKAEYGTTDSSGTAKVTGNAVIDVAVYVSKQGYYESAVEKIKVFHKKDKKDIYFDPEVEVELRDIRRPVKMLGYMENDTKIPVTNECAGFDLMLNDWVAPHGRGVVSDFVFKVEGGRINKDEFDVSLKLSFSNDGDGLVNFDGHKMSEFISPYEAPADGYSLEKNWRRQQNMVFNAEQPRKEPKKIFQENVSWDANYIFRVRTKRDGEGKIISAYYGKLSGDPQFWSPKDGKAFLRLNYYINTEANERSLECDLKKLPSLPLSGPRTPDRP